MMIRVSRGSGAPIILARIVKNIVQMISGRKMSLSVAHVLATRPCAAPRQEGSRSWEILTPGISQNCSTGEEEWDIGRSQLVEFTI